MRPLKGDSTPRAVRRLLAMLKDRGLSHGDFMRMRIADKRGNLAKRPYTLSQIKIRLGKLMEEINGDNAFTVTLILQGKIFAGFWSCPPAPGSDRSNNICLNRCWMTRHSTHTRH